MTETQIVGAVTETGAEGSPSQPVSPQAQTPIDGDVAKLLAGLGDKFDGLEKQLRGLQGRQDKTENNFQAQLAKLNQYKAQGLTDDEALAEMQSDDAADAWRKNLETKIDGLAARIAGAGTQANEQQQAAKVFENIGLDLKDPRVAVALTQKYETPESVELAAYRLREQIKTSPSPNSAQGASMQGGNTTGGLNEAQVETMSIELAKLYDNASKNAPQITVLEKRLEEYWAGKK